MKTSTETLVKAMHMLANGIQSDDGVANAAIYEAAMRLEEQEQRIKRLEEAGDELLMWLGEDISESNGQLLQDAWNQAKEAKP